MNEKEKIAYRYKLLKGSLNQKTTRLFAWAEALSLWYWWVKIIEEVTWISHGTIIKGKQELESEDSIITSDRIRREWWWRNKLIDKDPKIAIQIEKELDGNTIWNPMSLITWTTKSLTNLAEALKQFWLIVWRDVICRYLKSKWYSLQWNKKVLEWWDHIDRNAQFLYIKNKSEKFIEKWYPVISIDTKKKELVWNFKNSWQNWHKKWEWIEVNVYDFPNDAKWKAVPYWVYDIINNIWWVSVWVSADTWEFSVNSIRNRRYNMWKEKFNKTKKIYINCDGGWSNWSRCRLRKIELQKLSNEIWKELHISHFPPWTSKWNKIEHRMFCHISQNWKWIPLDDFMTIVNLISNTKTSKWLHIKCVLDNKIYQKWIKISDKEIENINIKKDKFHWERNYIISPKKI